jgi:hypothetical protein
MIIEIYHIINNGPQKVMTNPANFSLFAFPVNMLFEYGMSNKYVSPYNVFIIEYGIIVTQRNKYIRHISSYVSHPPNIFIPCRLLNVSLNHVTLKCGHTSELSLLEPASETCSKSAHAFEFEFDHHHHIVYLLFLHSCHCFFVPNRKLFHTQCNP